MIYNYYLQNRVKYITQKSKNIKTIDWMITQLGGKVINVNGTDVDFIVYDAKTVAYAKTPFESEGKTIPVNKQFVIGKYLKLIYRRIY